MNLMKFTDTIFCKTGKTLKSANRMVPFTDKQEKAEKYIVWGCTLFRKGIINKIEIVIFGEDIIGMSISRRLRLGKWTYLELLIAFSFLSRIVDTLIIFIIILHSLTFILYMFFSLYIILHKKWIQHCFYPKNIL